MHRSGFFALLLVTLPTAAHAEPISYFRADRGLAANDAQPLPDSLESPAWRVEIAPGHSTPCVYGDRIFLTTFVDEKLSTVALGRATGKTLWKAVAPTERIESYHPTGSPAVSTPVCDGQRLYVFFGSYGMLCYDLDGKTLWTKPMGPFQDEFGSGSSPILVDGKLLLNEDHDKDSFLIAIDPATGKTLWKTPRDGFTRSYATPMIWDIGGRKQVIVAGALQLTGYDLADGRALWTVDGLARIVNTTPCADDGRLIVATWSPGGDTDARIAMEPWADAVKKWDANGDRKLSSDECTDKDVLDRFYRIDLNQDKGLDEAEWNKYARVFELARNSIMSLRPSTSGNPNQVELAWEYTRGIPYVASPLLYRGVIYLAKDGGIVTTLDAATGKLLKQGRARGAGSYYASPVAGDGKVYLASDPGVVTILSADANWKILSSHDFAERIVASPVIADSQIFIRTEKALYCYGK